MFFFFLFARRRAIGVPDDPQSLHSPRLLVEAGWPIIDKRSSGVFAIVRYYWIIPGKASAHVWRRWVAGRRGEHRVCAPRGPSSRVVFRVENWNYWPAAAMDGGAMLRFGRQPDSGGGVGCA